MTELTVEALRDKLENDIKVARAELAILEGQLEWLEKQIRGEAETSKDISGSGEVEIENLSLVATASSSEKMTVGRAIKELMLDASGEFNVPGIANVISRQFPDIKLPELKGKCSQVASRLHKKGKITRVQKGEGREPNIYKSNKLVGK